MPRIADGWGSGLLGVIIFSGSLPATRVAVGGFTPVFLTSARAVIAALLGAGPVLALRPERLAASAPGRSRRLHARVPDRRPRRDRRVARGGAASRSQAEATSLQRSRAA